MTTIFDAYDIIEPEYTLTHRDEALWVDYPHIRQIDIAKVGGGTLGAAYDGDWVYRVTFMDYGREAEQGADLRTGMPHTHHEAALELAEYFPVDVDV